MSTDQKEITLHFLDYWRVLRIRWPFIVLVFLTVVLTAGVTTYFSKRLYSAAAKVEIRQGDYLMQIFNRQSGSPGGGMGPQRGDPRFLTTQFEIIQTKEVLYPVIQNLNLVQKWADQGVTSIGVAYDYLRQNMKVRDLRNTDLIEITVFSENPELAATIANAIADQYKKVRTSQVDEWLNRSLDSLKSEVDKQRDAVTVLRKKAAELRQKYNIIDLNPDQIANAQQAGDQVYLGIEESVSKERLRVASLRSRYEEIKALNDQDILRSMATLEILDPTLQKIFPEMQQVAAEEARLLNAGLGPNHPTIRSLRGTRAEQQRQIEMQISALRTSQANQLRIAEESLNALESELNDARSAQQGSKSNTVEYIEAKTAYIQALSLLQSAEERLSAEKMQLTMPQSPAIVWELAEPSARPVRPRVLLNMVLGVVVGLVLGIGSAFFLEYLDTSVKTMEEVESGLGIPVLAVIPKNMNLLPQTRGLEIDSEAYRILRTNVEFNRKNPDANVFTVVSGGAGEGKSTTIANLAYTFAQGGYNTIVIDADIRRPTQHKIFGFDNDNGLADHLHDDVPLEEVVKKCSTNDNLYVMTSGHQPSDVVAMLSGQRMEALLSEVKRRFDIIFIDSPPILGVSDASVLASLADLTIIVVQHRRFPKSMLLRVKNAILNVGGNVLGVVLNNVDIRHDQNYEYYTSYYKYYSKSQNESKSKKKREPRSASPEESASQPAGESPSETKREATPKKDFDY